MWFQGHIEDCFERSGRTIVRLPEEGRDPPTIFIFRSARLDWSHRSQSVRILQYGRRLLLDYAQYHISLHDHEHNIERIFLMIERFCGEWGQ